MRLCHATPRARGGAIAKANGKNVTPVGLEPTRIAPPELESGAFDHSAKVSCDSGRPVSWAGGALSAAQAKAYIP